jgi:energy-converting hydrogenase A subunit M
MLSKTDKIMCKIEDILNTEYRVCNEQPTAQKGMTTERVRFNTDIVFSIAKKLEMPLDKTADLMRRKGAFKRLGKAFTRRKTVSVKTITDEIAQSLLEA